jgi:hypothetical protein
VAQWNRFLLFGYQQPAHPFLPHRFNLRNNLVECHSQEVQNLLAVFFILKATHKP